MVILIFNQVDKLFDFGDGSDSNQRTEVETTTAFGVSVKMFSFSSQSPECL